MNFAPASAVKLSTRSFDRNLCHSVLISGLIQSSSSFSARARYSESVSISNTSNLFTSQNLVKKLQYSSNIRSFAYWRMKNPTMMGSFCSICALASSISCNEMFTWSSFLNNFLLMAACVFLSVRYFATVCRLQSVIWYPYDLLARSFIVSATIVEFGFSSPCLLASAADCTKLLKHFFRVLNKAVHFYANKTHL